VGVQNSKQAMRVGSRLLYHSSKGCRGRITDFRMPFAGSAACTPCPADTWAFSSSIGATDSSVCNSCAQSSSSDPGSVGFTTCKCNMGYTGSDGAPCPPCPAGSYKDSMGSAACTGCQAGTWSDTVAATVDSTCTTCHGNHRPQSPYHDPSIP
jgi:hypothetical protein